MKYLCLAHEEEAPFHRMSPEEWRSLERGLPVARGADREHRGAPRGRGAPQGPTLLSGIPFPPSPPLPCYAVHIHEVSAFPV
jgi:hypothetical protein